MGSTRRADEARSSERVDGHPLRIDASGGAADESAGAGDTSGAKIVSLEERIAAMELASVQRQADLLTRLDDLASGRRPHTSSSSLWSGEDEPASTLPSAPRPLSQSPSKKAVLASQALESAPTPAEIVEAAGRVEPQQQPRRPGRKPSVERQAAPIAASGAVEATPPTKSSPQSLPPAQSLPPPMPSPPQEPATPALAAVGSIRRKLRVSRNVHTATKALSAGAGEKTTFHV